MIKSITESPLYRIINPRSIAIFGASNNFSRMGSIILSSVQALGYEGAIYPIHPTEKVVRGLKAYPTIADLPEIPDLAIIVLPTEIVCRTINECGRKGIRHAVVVSGGFRETGAEGARLQKELEAIADNYGMRFLGPNCLGVANPHLKFNPTPLRAEGPAGFVGLASQSGSFVTQMFNYLHRHGLGFSTALSVGNEANIDLVDCLQYLAVCPNTKVIAIYVEGISRGRQFVETAKEISLHKPIVALYVGGSEMGKRAGLSHTGSIAGPDELYEGVFRQCGIIRARSITELFDFALALGRLPRPQGNRVIVQTHSGGPGATAADACGTAGLVLPPLSPETVDKLRPLIPHTASTANPVDMTFSKNQADDFYKIPDLLLQEKDADMLMVYFVSPGVFIERLLNDSGMAPELARQETQKIIDELTNAFLSLRSLHHKPIVGYTYQSIDEGIIKKLLERGFPVYEDAERAARSLAALIRYYTMRDRRSRATRGSG
ncbi:MAG: CoA-binding protein [Deltaproteobacteria bacterium]|nr:CoA-binding protein [Deltaproteobacteria bacterium]